MAIDTSMFSSKDAFDIGLQRTAHLKSRLAFRCWTMGWSAPLRFEAWLRRTAIVNGALSDAQREFEEIASYIGYQRISRIVDIGCGHALIDLFFWRRYRCTIHLVDIESTSAHHHDLHETGAGYASLDAAKLFLTANGVPPSSVRLTNPQRRPLKDSDCDIVMSLLSCGFHYPAATYGDFVKSALRPGGAFIFDMRKRSGQEAFLDGFCRHDVIRDTAKYQRVAAVNGN
jgi:SAM-dependent methyltransferase